MTAPGERPPGEEVWDESPAARSAAEPPADGPAPVNGPRGERATDDSAVADQPRGDQPPTEGVRRAEQTRDDTDVGWGEVPEPSDAHDRWLREQRPPHWD